MIKTAGRERIFVKLMVGIYESNHRSSRKKAILMENIWKPLRLHLRSERTFLGKD
jgi:hypothetical protein